MRSIFFLFILLITSITNSQINPLRYNDNFKNHKNDSLKKGLATLKEIKIGDHQFISFGGEIREQFQYFDHINFGDVPQTFSKSSTGQLWHRLMLHSNIELGEKFRVFIQGVSNFRFFNPNPFNDVDENRLGLHQGFFDFYPNSKTTFRIGRQEVGYGNNRILTSREGPNNRLSFDAVLFKYTSDKRRFDLFAMSPVLQKQYVSDDLLFTDAILGFYGTEMFHPKKLMLDYYFLNFKSNQRRYNYVSGNENRQSFGLRIFSNNSSLNYELETTYQTGTFNDLKINAYSISADVNYLIYQKNRLILGLNTNFISGDKNNSDQELNTYNLIFSKPSYGLAAPIGSSNIININPYLRFSPINKLNVNANVYFLKRNSTQDGTYTPAMTENRPAPNILFLSNNKSIGTQYAFEINYQYNTHLFFAIDTAYFEAGNYVKDTGKGQNITYWSFKTAFKF